MGTLLWYVYKPYRLCTHNDRVCGLNSTLAKCWTSQNYIVLATTCFDSEVSAVLESLTIVGLATTLAWIFLTTSELETFTLFQRQQLIEADQSFRSFILAPSISQLLFFLPILAPIHFTFASWKAVMVMSAISLVCTISVAVTLSTKAAVVQLTSLTILAHIIQYSGRMQQMKLFQCMANYNEVLEKRAQDHYEAAIKLKEETRNIVASFCHDTKTPLAAMAAGMETVKTLLSRLQNDMQAKSNGLQTDAATFQQSIESVQSTMSHVGATFQLTLMAVNRAADYTKAKYEMDFGPIFETFHLQLAVDNVLGHIRSLFVFESITVEPIPEEIASFIVTDRNWLIEGLMELSLNAIKYSSDNKAILSIQLVQGFEMMEAEGFKECKNEIAKQYDGEQFLRFVVDNIGNELSAQEIEAAFQPTDFSKQSDVGGLKAGIYCLARRSAALGGCCGMTPLLTDGSSGMKAWFTIPYRSIELPMKESEAFRVSSLDTVGWESGAGLNQASRNVSMEDLTFNPEEVGLSNPIRVLIVDDAVTITKMLTKQFEHNGFFIDVATNGQEALMKVFTVCAKLVVDLPAATKEEDALSSRSAESEHPEPERWEKNFDLILMDLQMPVMDGFTAIREIRTREVECDRHSIIAMSANSDQGMVIEAYAAGADYFLQKPCKLLSVQQLLREYYTGRMREKDCAPELQL